MSRIVVKNVPKQATEDQLRKLFSEKGQLTDVQLKYTAQGKFRGMAFIGFQTEEEANAAKDYFNMTYIGTSVIKVEICAKLGDMNKPRAWSKYSKESSSYQKSQLQEEKLEQTLIKFQTKEKSDKNPPKEIDPELAEFLKLHKPSNQQLSWENDADFNTGKPDKNDHDGKESANKISDLEYLKSKISKDAQVFQDDVQNPNPNKEKMPYAKVEVYGLPIGCKKSDIDEFFAPCVIKRYREKPKQNGAIIYFEQENMEDVMRKNKTVMGDQRITILQPDNENYKMHWRKMTEELEGTAETIAESGRIFARNLSYTVTEEDINNLFSKYGKLSEVVVPIDKNTRVKKGFALITFMIPENAFTAFCELDGTIFQGRMLHLLPGKTKPEKTVADDDKNFKDKKNEKLKATSQSSRNWNSLFLGANAVADIVSDKYNVSKEELLIAEGSHSVAVRMALGETQIVTETRDFLTENGVVLDAFSQPTGPRSKTVILVKNLPANTTADDMKEVFKKYGELGRVVMPPRGITAIVEFTDPSEARKAFQSLAYTRYQHVPLYLEWAPVKVFAGEYEAKKPEPEQEDDEVDDAQSTLFVKNIHLGTAEDEIKSHFEKCGKIKAVTIARKLDTTQPGKLISMGYCFIRFKKRESVIKAMRELQSSQLGGRTLELKLSERITTEEASLAPRKSVNSKLAASTKIMVRNVPFEATRRELEELFGTFGELKNVRMPKRFNEDGSAERHRGFAFVEFLTKQDAKRAFSALCQSTHLYGRRMVLEWANQDESVGELREKTRKRFLQDAQPNQRKFKKAKTNLFTDQQEDME